MYSAYLFEWIIKIYFYISPYTWIDFLLRRKQYRYRGNQEQHKRWKEFRYWFSEIYAGLFAVMSGVLFCLSSHLGEWVAWFLLLQIFWILNKEFGVIIFGICNVTEGKAVSRSERVITMALINFFGALIAFACVYAVLGRFNGVQEFEGIRFWALQQALQMHFTLSPAFEPIDAVSRTLIGLHGAFSFLFATIIISIFVSLINLR